jgi:hypothetical protein
VKYREEMKLEGICQCNAEEAEENNEIAAKIMAQ